jgi:hypothetical protein
MSGTQMEAYYIRRDQYNTASHYIFTAILASRCVLISLNVRSLQLGTGHGPDRIEGGKS